MIKQSLAGHVYPLDKTREAYKTLISKPERNRAFMTHNLEQKNNLICAVKTEGVK